MSFKKTIVFPVLVLGLGLLIAVAIVKSRPEPDRQPAEAPDPVVRVIEARSESVALHVSSQGTVRPRTESQLVAQVAGEVIEIGPAFAEGGFFDKGDLLVRIDSRDFQLAVSRADAQLAQAELRLQQELAQAEVAREEWQTLGQGSPSALTLREPQVADARASVKAAEASLELARLNLARTEIRAPYTGRVRSKQADLGQFVRVGSVLATLFSIDRAEVRLPVPQDQLAFLDVSLDGSDNLGSTVHLTANLGGEPAHWQGRVVRTAGELDPRSRMFNLIAQVDDPYGRRSDTAVLPVGLFVDARIEGRSVDGVVTLPRTALRDGSRVLVLEEGHRLRFRDVEILRIEGNEVLLTDGVADGELVCVSQLDAVVDGMRVEPLREEFENEVTGP